MKSKYEKVTLDQLSKIFSGFAFKSADLIEESDEAYPVIKIANIQNKKVLKFGSGYLPKDQFVEKLEKYKLDQDDFLVAMTGAGSVGKVGKMRNPDQTYLVNQRVGIVRSDKEKVNPEYLFQVLSDDCYEDYLYQLGVGSGQPNVSATDIGNLKVPYPDLETQQKIASILSAFDDLIENNTRRIAILEEMARLIYREWFVNYRYPGHKSDNLVDSGTELGDVPEGWGIKTLEDLCELIVGQSPKSEFYNETGDGLPFHQGVKDFGSRFPTTTTWCTVQKRIAEKGDILLSVRAPVGRINIANCKMIIGRGLHAIRSKTGSQVFIFEQLKYKFQEEDSMGSGTIYKSVTKGDMLGLKLIYPGKKLIDLFEEKAEPIFEQIRILNEKNIYLKETRDLLLPKLISGKVDV